MSFTAQPSTSSLHSKVSSSRGGTLLYTFATTVVGNANPPALEVEFFINGSKITGRTLYIDNYVTRVQDGSDYDYAFEIDASEVVRDFFDDAEFFNQAGIYNADSLRAELQLKIYTYTPSASNILTKSGSTTNSSICTALNSINTYLTPYRGATSKILSTAPLESYYVLGEQYYISMFCETLYSNHARIRSYSETDTLIGTIVVDLLGAKPDDQITVLSLLDSDIEGYTAENGGSVDIAEAYYFVVDFGSWSDPIFTSRTDTRTYYVLTDAYRKLTFSWQNHFGTPESYTLYDDNWSTQKQTDRKTYRSANGVTAYQITTQEQTQIELYNLDNETFAYLSQISESLIFYIGGVLHYSDNFSIITNEIENSNDIKIILNKSLETVTH